MSPQFLLPTGLTLFIPVHFWLRKLLHYSIKDVAEPIVLGPADYELRKGVGGIVTALPKYLLATCSVITLEQTFVRLAFLIRTVYYGITPITFRFRYLFSRSGPEIRVITEVCTRRNFIFAFR